MDEAEEAIADLVDSMEAFGGDPPELLEEVFEPEVPLMIVVIMIMMMMKTMKMMRLLEENFWKRF